MGASTTGGQMESGPSASGRNSPGRAGGTCVLIVERISSGTLEEREPAPAIRAPLALGEAGGRFGQVDAALAADDESPVGGEAAGAESQELRDQCRIIPEPGERRVGCEISVLHHGQGKGGRS